MDSPQYANGQENAAYIWQSGKDASVVTVAKVLSSPETMTRLDEEERYFLDKSLSGAEPALRVRVRVERVLANRVTRQQFRDHPVLSQVSILKQAQGTVFPLTDEQAAALDALLTGAEVTRHIIRVGVPRHNATASSPKGTSPSAGPRWATCGNTLHRQSWRRQSKRT